MHEDRVLEEALLFPVPDGIHKYTHDCRRRYDVLLTGNQPSRSYFITVASQYRPGAPYGYGLLRYSDASATDLPPTPTVQTGTIMPWNQSQIVKVCVLSVHMSPAHVILLAPEVCVQQDAQAASLNATRMSCVCGNARDDAPRR